MPSLVPQVSPEADASVRTPIWRRIFSFCLLAGFLVVLFFESKESTQLTAEPGPSGILYRVTREEWGETAPTLRQIHDRYGVAPENFPATRAANAPPGECAPPDASRPYGDVIIAISPEGGEHCMESSER